MADSIAALDRELRDAGPRPVYIVQGEERLLVDEAVRMIVTAAVGDPDDAMSVQRVDLAESDRSSRHVLAACQSMGLFSQRLAVLVRAAERLDKDKASRDDLANYVQAPNTEATLILVATKLDGKSALVKRTKKHGRVLTFAPPKLRDVPVWVSDEARRLGHRIDHGACRLVAELVGTDLQRLRLAVDQLSLYAGPEQPITEAAVSEVLAATRAHGIFELVDAVGERRAGPALSHLHAMLEQREPPLRILAMLIRHFRMLWQVQALKHQGATLDGAQRELGLHPFQAKKLWRQSTLFDAGSIRGAYEQLFATDLRLKSKGVADGIAMEQLLLDLCR